MIRTYTTYRTTPMYSSADTPTCNVSLPAEPWLEAQERPEKWHQLVFRSRRSQNTTSPSGGDISGVCDD